SATHSLPAAPAASISTWPTIPSGSPMSSWSSEVEARSSAFRRFMARPPEGGTTNNVGGPVDSRTFLAEVREHQLLTMEQLASAEQRFGPDAPVHDLSAALVDQGWLTEYQVQEIW